MKKIILIISLILFFNKPSLSGEITDTEWSGFSYYIITYYDGTNSKKIICTVFNSSGTPIGGFFGYTHGGVAKISISLPEKYFKKEVSAKCG